MVADGRSAGYAIYEVTSPTTVRVVNSQYMTYQIGSSTQFKVSNTLYGAGSYVLFTC